MREPISLLIGAARRRMKRFVTDRVREHGLSALQFWVMINVDEADGASLTEVAARLRMDVPTTSRTVTQLLKRKLVKAEGDEADRRRLRLRLAPGGKERMEPLRTLAAELRGATIHGLSREEEETLRLLLRKSIANLDKLIGDAGEPVEDTE